MECLGCPCESDETLILTSTETNEKSSPNDYPATIPARILSLCERNFIRLRIAITSRIFPDFGQAGICRFGPRSLVKYCAATRAAEAANMEYIARNTTIPVPRIQDVFIIGRQTYIVMDYIDAPELTYVWWTLSAEQQRGVIEEVRNYIAQMRSLRPPHPGKVECVDGTGVYDARLTGVPFPPFSCVADFHHELGHDFVLQSEAHREAWPQFQAIKERSSSYQTKFTHSDIAPRNILVKDGKIAALIDWETAGWYPEYWEYTRWKDSHYRSAPAWHEARDEITERYPEELWVEKYLGRVFTRL